MGQLLMSKPVASYEALQIIIHGACYFSNGLFIDLEATVGTYELRSYGGEQ